MDQTSVAEKVYQREKYEEIINALITAGYFRALINTLSEFDKIVGGLCWCITSSGEDVDVDILFSENSTIGQRIALSESIVVALRKMRCPIQLQPHQIQGGVGGSDFPVLCSVISWLIKTYFERKDRFDVQFRKYSVLQFSKNFEIPNDPDALPLSPYLQRLVMKSKPTRLFKRANYIKSGSEESQVRACLLEYGESSSSFLTSSLHAKGSAASAMAAEAAGPEPAELAGQLTRGLAKLKTSDNTSLSAFEKKLAQAQREAQREEQQREEAAGKEAAVVIQNMSRVDDSAYIISGSRVGNLVAVGSDVISAAAEAYQHAMEDTMRGLSAGVASGKLGKAALYGREKQLLERQKAELDSRVVTLQEDTQLQRRRLQLLEEEKADAQAYQQELETQLKKMKELEVACSKQQELSELRRLVELQVRLKKEETEFKASCRAQLKEFTERIEWLEQQAGGGGGEADEDTARLASLEDLHGKILARYNKLREQVAEATQAMASASRQIDDIPTRTELLQYERRFGEVYQQVGWKLEETRKYFDAYNSLDTKLNFLQKEVKLLDTIGDSFDLGMRSAQNKQEFLQQFKLIVKGVEESLDRQDAVLSRKFDGIEAQKKTLLQLMDEQRRYVTAVQELQGECAKNDWLVNKLQEITSTSS